jgi:hypothetical protein
MLETDERTAKSFSACEAYKQPETWKEGYTRSRKLHHFPSEPDAKEGLVSVLSNRAILRKVSRFWNSHDLISAGLFASVERFYTTLQSQAPYETRILEGLKTLYQASGDEAKLADIQVSLNILSGNVTEERSVTPDSHSAQAEDDTGVAGHPGLIEIDFTMAGEVETGPQGDDPADASSVGNFTEYIIPDEVAPAQGKSPAEEIDRAVHPES